MVGSKDIELVIFDFDGTLFNLKMDWGELELALKPFRRTESKLGDDIQHWMDNGISEPLAILDEAEVKGAEAGKLLEGGAEAIQQLQSNCKVAIFTRNSRRCVLKALELAKIDASKLHIIAREDVKQLKPEPEGIELLLSNLKVARSSTVMIGDTFHDIDSAHKAGVLAVIVRNPSLEYIPEGADFYVDNLPRLFSLNLSA